MANRELEIRLQEKQWLTASHSSLAFGWRAVENREKFVNSAGVRTDI
jgi:hypothetical protein